MKNIYFLTAIAFFIVIGFANAQEEGHEAHAEHMIKRHRVGVFLGNALIHGVKNTQTNKEQYVLAPTLGLDYTYALNQKWAIGTYNEVNHVDIEVETETHDEFIKRENTLLVSGVVVFEPIPKFGIFVGTGFETDPNETLWIRYMGLEYSFINTNDWHVALTTGFINKEKYNAFNFGVVISRGFGKIIPSKGQH
jgi:hypothetical protein